MNSETKRFWRWVSVAVGICAIISWAAIYFTRVNELWGDAYFWHHAANLFADGKGFILPFQYLSKGTVLQSADHPPLFTMYLSVFSLVGLDSEGAHQFATTLITLAAVPSFAIVARRLGGTTVGIIAGVIAAVHPVIWGWNKMIMSEPLAVLAVAWLLWVAVDWRDRVREGNVRWYHAARFGLFIGLAALTRSELLLLGVLLAFVAMFTRPVLRTLIPLTIAGATTLLTFAPWIGYNLSRFERPVYLSIGANGTLVATNCDVVYDGPWIGYWSIGCALDSRKRAEGELAALGITQPDQSQLSHQMGSYWREYMWDHKTQVPKVVAARIARVMGLYKPFQQMALDRYPEGRDEQVVYGAWAMFALLIPLSVLGGRALRGRDRFLMLMLTPIPAALFAVSVTFGNTRYRIAAEPAMIVLGALGIGVIVRTAITLWNAPNSSVDGSTTATNP